MSEQFSPSSHLLADVASACSSPYSSTPGVPLPQESHIVTQRHHITSRRIDHSRLETPLGTLQSRTSTGTPYPSVSHGRSRSSLSQRSYRSSEKRSVVSSSYPHSQRGSVSTASGRKSRATSSIWGSDGHQVICAVSEARGVSPSVGLAFVNITTNEAILSQICDSQFYVKTIHKISMYDPDTILMASTAFPPNPKSSLLSMLEEEFHGTNVESLDRRYWSETAGIDAMYNLAFREDLESIQVAMQGNFYATCAFAAVSA
jgi:DNA mismatch repair protein MSH4